MSKKDYRGKVILITTGGTREYIDPVRFITNASSGKMGLALAQAVHSRKGKVILIIATQNYPKGLPFKVIPVESAREMFKEVRLNFLKADIIIMAAAVSDFRPEKYRVSKISKDKNPKVTLKLIRNPDILSWLGKRKGKRVLVGFCAEIEDVEHRTKKKLKDKNADLMIGVDLEQIGGVIGKDFAQAKLIEKNGLVTAISRRPKRIIAHLILDKISGLINQNA